MTTAVSLFQQGFSKDSLKRSPVPNLKIRVASNIGPKGYSIPFLSALYQNKAFIFSQMGAASDCWTHKRSRLGPEVVLEILRNHEKNN